MNRILAFPSAGWASPFPADVQRNALHALEQGQVLHFPSLHFPLGGPEVGLLDPAILHRSKNVSFNPATGRLGGTSLRGEPAEVLRGLVRRYADATQTLLQNLLPHYGGALRRERTSLRPAAIEGRQTSWRKDDTRLHVDSFPATPVHGRRLLRVFCNINPAGRPRTWRLGEPFAVMARRFWPRLRSPRWLRQRLLALLRVTRGVRSEYDHYMLQLHDAMKADEEYQRTVAQETVDWPAGSTWICFTDQASHAAMAGQHQLEQTFTLPVGAMRDPSTSPLHVLGRLAGRPLTEAARRAA